MQDLCPQTEFFLLAHAQSACNLCAEGRDQIKFPGQDALDFLIIDWSTWWPFCCWQQYTHRYLRMDLPLLGSLPWGYPGLLWLTVCSESPQLARLLDISCACHPWKPPRGSCPLAILHGAAGITMARMLRLWSVTGRYWRIQEIAVRGEQAKGWGPWLSLWLVTVSPCREHRTAIRCNLISPSLVFLWPLPHSLKPSWRFRYGGA